MGGPIIPITTPLVVVAVVRAMRVAFSWLFSRKLMSACIATQRTSLPRYFGVSVAQFSQPFGFELEEGGEEREREREATSDVRIL